MASPTNAMTAAEIPQRLNSPAGLVAMAWVGSLVAVLAEYPLGGFAKNREELWGFWLAFAGTATAVSFFYSRLSGFTLTEAGWNVKFQHRAHIWPFFVVIAVAIAATFARLISRQIWFPRNYHPSLLGEVCICTICPVAEELLYRGWFQTALARIRPAAREWMIVSTSAGAFALAHFFRLLHGETLGPIAITVGGAFFLGLIAGRARQTTGNMVTPIALHIVYNVTAVLLMHWLFVVARSVRT